MKSGPGIMGSRICLRMNPISAPALVCLSVWVLLSLVSVPSLADICFEGTPRNSFSGRRFHVTGSEFDGQVCITVVRAPEDVDDLDYEQFDYSVSALGNPVFGQGTAAAGVDFLTSSGTITFPDGATSVEICAAVLADDVACESGEDFQIRITSPNPAFNSICDVERAIVTLQDFTVITAAFAPLPAMFEVLENAGQFNVEVIRFGGVQNINVAEFMIMEDPATPGCLAGPATVRYQCVAPRCGGGSMYNLTENIVSEVTLNLAPDDTLINGTKRCRIIFAPFSGSSCRFAFIGGSRPLAVRDNERFLMEFIPFNFYEAMEDEGGVDVTVEVRSLTGIGPLVLDKAVNFSLGLSVDPGNNPAQIGVDLPDQPYSSSVLAGQTSATVRILFTPDLVYEETEIVLATLLPTEDFNIIAPVRPATIQIINDDSVTIVFPDSISVSESDGELVFSLIVLEDHEVDICLFVLSAASPGDPDSNPTIAKAGEDFAVIRQEVCFKDSSNRSEVVAVPILGSGANVPEEDKTFVLIVELPSEASDEFFNLPDQPGYVMLLDTSDTYMIKFSQAEYGVTESMGQLEVAISVDRPPAFDVPFTVRASTSGTGPQYAIVGKQIGGDILGDEWSGFIPSGMTSAEFSIDIVEDNLAEYNEEFTLDLAVSSLTPRFAIVGESLNEAQVVILDNNDPECSFDPTSYSVDEGSSVTLMLTCSVTASVDYTLAVGSDVAGDLSLSSTTVTIGAGSTQGSVELTATADNIKECEESFQLTATLTNSSTALGVTIGDGTATVAIADTTEDVAINFDPASYTVSEGSSVEVFLTADKDYTEAFTVTVTSVNTEDITIQPSTVTFQPPSKRVSVMVEAVTDTIQEPTESVALTFTIGDSCLESVIAGDQDEATVSITDTSDAVVVCFEESTYSVTEGAEVTIGLSADKDFTSSFSATVTHAAPDGDFTLEGVPVTFTPGGTSGSFRFVSTTDTVKELDETVSLMLQIDDVGGIDVEICSQSTSMVTIVDDDDLEVSFSPVVYNVMEGGSVTVTLQADTMAQVDYSIDVTLDSAAAADLTLDSSTVEFSAGSTQATVVATGTADNIKECEESFQLTASLTDSSTALGVTIGDGIATVAIADTTEDVAINFDPASYTASEGSSVEVFLTADKDYTEAFTVTVSSVNTEDITIQPNTVTFRPPNKRVSVMVEAVTDAIQKPAESVILTFTIGDSCLESVVAGSADQATVSITDTSDAVVVCFDESAYSVTEGAQVTIGLTADKDFASLFVMTVTPTDQDGLYSLEGIPVTFTPGDRTGSFQFVSTADDVKELDETVSLTLQVDDNGGIDVEICFESATMVTVRDDDNLSVQFELEEYSVSEGGTITVNVVASAEFSKPFIVDISHDGAEDLSLSSPTLSFSPSSRTASVELTATTDSIKEPEESFTLTLAISDSMTQQFGVQLGTRSTAAVNVQDSSAIPTVGFMVSRAKHPEGARVNLTVNRTGFIANPLNFSVRINTRFRSAQESDYDLETTVVVFSQVKSYYEEQNVTVLLINDGVKEIVQEYFILSLHLEPGLSVAYSNQYCFVIIEDVNYLRTCSVVDIREAPFKSLKCTYI